MTRAALFLHIGHHRTGTTTLQKRVFPHLARIAYLDKNSLASNQIETAFRSSPLIWRARGSDIFANLRAELGRQNRSALISREGMSAHRIFAAPGTRNSQRNDPCLMAAHLAECQTLAKKIGFGDVKVIVGIRRQDQRFASRYAEAGPDHPGQEDFERQTREIIDPDKRYFVDGVWLDYKATFDLLADVVGDGNVIMLPLEQLADDPPRYLAALSVFLGENLNRLRTDQRNTRWIASDVWQMKCDSLLRKKPLGRLRALLARPVPIRLTPELKKQILLTYRESNRSLGSALNLNLALHGYY